MAGLLAGVPPEKVFEFLMARLRKSDHDGWFSLDRPLSTPAPKNSPVSKGSAPLETKEVMSLTEGLVLAKKRTARPRRRRGRRGKSRLPSLPPKLQCAPVHRATFRFDVQSTMVQQNVTNVNLLGVAGSVGVTTSSVTTFASAVRLRRIKIWPAAGGEATVQWNGTTQHMPEASVDVTLPTGITVSEATDAVPDAYSFAALWWSAGASAQALFQLSATAGSIVDVDLDYCLATAESPQTISVASSVVGTVYYGYLDGPSTHIMKPLGRPSTF